MSRIKELHMGKTIKDLEPFYSLDSAKIESKSAAMLCNSAKKLLEAAEKHRLDGDEEASFVSYMKYMNLMSKLQKAPDFKTKRDFIHQVVGSQKNLNKIYDQLEKLQGNLVRRYNEKYGPQAPLTESKSNEINSTNNALHQDPNNMVAIENERTSIPSKNLFDMINGDNNQKILIMDCRPIEDYQKSHINYRFSINVPPDNLTIGMSAHKIHEDLPNESKIFWEFRTKRPIIFFDWFSSRLERNSPLWHLKEILTQWDADSDKKPDMMILEGGYDDFLTRYPMKCTDPHVERPSRDIDGSPPSVDGIEYPTLEEIEMKDKTMSMDRSVIAPTIDRSMKKNAVEAHERSIGEVIEELEQVMDKSLQNEKEWLNAENDYKKVITEKENNDDTSAREQALIFKMWELQSKSNDYGIRVDNLNIQAHHGLENVKDPQVISKLAESERQLRLKKIEQQKLQEEREQAKKTREEAFRQAHALKPQFNDNRPIPKSQRTDELILSVKSLPVVDRATKPIQSNYQEDAQLFDPCYGKVEFGLTGLKNLGNTCYMNSIIQCLSNTQPLTNYLLDNKYERQINYNSKTKGRIIRTLASLIKMLWNGECKYISSKKLRMELGEQDNIFSGYDQQDSHEFLVMLIDWLHLDVQSLLALQKGSESLVASEKAWLEFTKERESFIMHLFYGQIKSTVKCTVCSKESSTYETFSNLSLELPESNIDHCDIIQCFNLYFHGERVSGWNCPHCKGPRDAIKKLDISKLPPVLVIHLKRFYADSYAKCTFRKKSCLVDFTLNDMNMLPYVARSEKNSPSNSKHIFNLYAVSNHYGSMESGHYTAYCKNYKQGKWYKFDDDRVSSLDLSDVKSSAAYILFYSAIPQSSYR